MGEDGTYVGQPHIYDCEYCGEVWKLYYPTDDCCPGCGHAALQRRDE